MRIAHSLFAILLVGCGSSSGNGMHNNPDGGDNTGMNGPTGYVSLTGAPANYLSAAFNTANPTSNLNCTKSTEGACTFSSCTRTGALPQPVSGGVVTVTGGAKSLTLMPMSDGTYTGVQQQMPIFQGGETLALTVAGDKAPAATLNTTAPNRPIITAPTDLSDDLDVVPIVRSNDLNLTWSGVPTGKLSAVIASSQPTPNQIILCQFDGAAGAGTVPSSLLQKIAAGQGYYEVFVNPTTTMKVGDWEMNFSVVAYGINSAGDNVEGAALLQ